MPKLLEVLTSPWTIVPEKLHEIRAVYETHMRGDKLDLKVLARPKPETPEQIRGYAIDGGVAVIHVTDVLTKNSSFFSFLFGGTSMRDIGAAFENARQDVDVHSIVLAIDSPGGTVDGTEELVGKILSARDDKNKRKTVIAYADGMMASGAYWIGAAADKIVLAGDTTVVGSIGVVATHVDYSEQDRAMGEKWTEITAGKYKRIASAHKPLSEEGRSYIQDQIDHIYSVFVESVSKARGRSVEQILEAADGRIFLGQQAIDAGLADEMSTLQSIINSLKEEHKMDQITLREKHPELYQKIADENRLIGAAEAKEPALAEGRELGKAEGFTAGAEAERERIRSIEAARVEGYEDIITAMKFDGAKTAADAKDAILEAVRQTNADALKKITDDAIKPVAHAAAPVIDGAVTDNLPLDERAKIAWDKNPELRGEFGGNFASYLAFEKHQGSIRIFSRKA
jgi:signal peptide peptidase SppA